MPLDGGDEKQRSGTVLLEDVDFNEKRNSSPRSSQFREDVCMKKRRFQGKIIRRSPRSSQFREDVCKKKRRFEGKIIRRRVGMGFPA